MSVNQELSSLVQRLESVATRLEKASSSDCKKAVSDLVAVVKRTPSPADASGLSAHLTALSNAISQLEISSGPPPGNVGGPGDSSAFVAAFDHILDGPFKHLSELSRKIGGEVDTQNQMVQLAFKAHRDYLVLAAKSRKPADSDLPALLKPMSGKISEIQSYREANRRSQYFNHLSAISESIPAIGWVTVSPAPGPFIKEMNDAGQFYTNRVLKDWKDKSKVHVEWTKAWVSTLSELQAYVKQHHTTGLSWNPKGEEAKSSSGTAGAPPPPPPPPASLFDDVPAAGSGSDQARNALFADLNKGEDVTKGLKKVTDDMKTHKNPNLRATGPQPPVKAKSPVKTSTAVATKPPRFELEGKKWNIEYQVKNQDIVIGQTEVNQSVYIFKCEGSTIKVEGKVNNIVMDSCKKSAVVFNDVVSSCEFINCQSVQMQVMGKVPTISVEKTDGCQMFLSKDSAATTEFITAKSSEMNVVIPTGDDFVEQAIPEQFKTTIAGTKLKTSATESV